MATITQQHAKTSRKKKAFIPSPRVLTPEGVLAIEAAIHQNSQPNEKLKRAFARYKAVYTVHS